MLKWGGVRYEYARRSWPEIFWARARSAALTVCPNAPRASSTNATPAGVSRAPRAPRSKSFTPSSRSRSAICLETACCARRSRLAALVKLPSSATAMQYRRCRSSKPHLSAVVVGTKLCWIFIHVQYHFVASNSSKLSDRHPGKKNSSRSVHPLPTQPSKAFAVKPGTQCPPG
jgi:hypothetical protein